MKCTVLSVLVFAVAAVNCSEGDQFLREIKNPKRRTHLTIRGKFEGDDAVPDEVEVVAPPKLRAQALEQRLTLLSEKLRGNDGFGAKLNAKVVDEPVVPAEKQRKRKKIIRKRIRNQNKGKNVNGVDQVAPEIAEVAVQMPDGEKGKFVEAIPMEIEELPKLVQEQIAALAGERGTDGNATSVANQYYVRVYASPFLTRGQVKDDVEVVKLEKPVVQKNSHQVIQVLEPQVPEPTQPQQLNVVQVYQQPQVQPSPQANSVQFLEAAPQQVVYQNNPDVARPVAEQPTLVETPVLRASPAPVEPQPHPPTTIPQQVFYQNENQQPPQIVQRVVLQPVPQNHVPPPPQPQQVVYQQQQVLQQPTIPPQQQAQAPQQEQQIIYQQLPQQPQQPAPRPQQLVFQPQQAPVQAPPAQTQQIVYQQQQAPVPPPPQPQLVFQQQPVQQTAPNAPSVRQQTSPVQNRVVYPTIVENVNALHQNPPSRHVVYPTMEERIPEPIIVQHIVQPSYTKIPSIQKIIQASQGSTSDQKPNKYDTDSEVIYPPSIAAPAVVKSRHRTVFSPVENPQPGQQVFTLNEIHTAATSYFHNTPFAQVTY